MAVMIGINPYKRSYTAVALDGTDKVLGQLRVAADRRQVDRLLRFSTAWPGHVWAVENANGLGRLLSRGLLEAGETVVNVPAKLSARVRALSGAGAQDRRARRAVHRDRGPPRSRRGTGDRR